MSRGDAPRAPRTAALAALHRSERPAEQIVAWRGTADTPRLLRFGRLLADVAGFARCIDAAGLAAGDRIGLWCPDAYAFAVGMLGAWQRACIVVSPPNDAPGTLEALAASGAAIACDAPGRPGAHPGLSLAFALADAPAHPPDLAALRALREAPLLEREAQALELSTSGTTADGKTTAKALRHLDDEVAVLERHFGASLGNARIVATPSHQHLYGLLFRVLWPLCAGRAFHAHGALQAEELLAAAGEREAFALVSVPAHLSRIAQREGATRLARGCVRVFSSGGPLAPATAARWRALCGRAPTEIFGSTETGGVAFREQAGDPDVSGRTPWQPFARVQIERAEGDLLVVRSPFVGCGTSDAQGADERFAMGDRVEMLGDGRFVLLGRADRTVKIGERRLSLPEMEARLAALPGVLEAALVTLEVAAEERVAAAVVPSDAALLDAEPEVRRAYARGLGDALARDFDRVLLPRAWRLVAALPEDAQGKRTTAALRALFATQPAAGETASADPAPAERSAYSDRRAADPGPAQHSTPEPAQDPPREPRRLDQRRLARGAEWLCEVPADLAHLDGHFPGQPIVPAVAQLGWALGFAAEEAGEALSIASIEQLRLREALRPGDRFWLRIEWGAPIAERGDTRAARELGFSLTAEDSAPRAREFASGRLVVERE